MKVKESYRYRVCGFSTILLIAVVGLQLDGIANAYDTWGPPELVGSGPGGADYPQIVCDTEGNAFVVWHQSDGTQSSIYANQYTPGSGWGTAQLIESGSGDAFYPEIACDPYGNVFAVWRQMDGTCYSIYSNRYVRASGWGTAELIEAAPQGANAAHIACDSSGCAFAVWEQWNGSCVSIYGNEYEPGSGWGTEAAIESVAGEAHYPRIACGASGNPVVVWYEYSGSFPTLSSVYASEYVSGSGWGPATDIDSGSEWAGIAEMACDPCGNAIAVWYECAYPYPENSCKIYANRYVRGSGWGTAELVQSLWVGDGYMPQITCDSEGNALAVWYQYEYPAAYMYGICANRYVPGRGWGTAQLIESGSEDAYDPQIACDSKGNGWAVWEQGSDVYANRYVGGEGWGKEDLVGTGGACAQVACDAQGNAFAVWSNWYQIYASRTETEVDIEVDIDIKPGSYPNAINPAGRGVIPVAILSMADFDATTVDPSTVQLCGAGVGVRGNGESMAREEDVDGDGLIDLVCQVEIENLDAGALENGEAILTGETFEGMRIRGTDGIALVPVEQ